MEIILLNTAGSYFFQQLITTQLERKGRDKAFMLFGTSVLVYVPLKANPEITAWM